MPSFFGLENDKDLVQEVANLMDVGCYAVFREVEGWKSNAEMEDAFRRYFLDYRDIDPQVRQYCRNYLRENRNDNR